MNSPKPVPNVLFEDDDYIVIDKPPNLLSIPDRFDQTLPNVLEMLRYQYDGILVVHRIDRPTSGVLAFAKNPEAHRSFCMAFERHEVHKTYLALVDGWPSPDKGTIDHPIGESLSRPGTVAIDKGHGKPAITDYAVVERYRGYTLVEAHPRSGRQHQIRIHFKTIGHPLAVDELYGNRPAIYLSQIKASYKPKPDKPEKPLMSRLTLHASQLAFCHHRTNAIVRVEAPLPKDFRNLLHQLGKFKG